MQFLKILFWCLLTFVAALFTYSNWTPVPVQLWGGQEALVKLPFLLLVVFLIGFLPTHLYHAAIRWRLRQRMATAERGLNEARNALYATTPPASSITPSASTTAKEGRLL